MTLADSYNEVRDSILSQRVEGSYVKSRPSQSYRTLLAIGVFNVALGLCAAFTYSSVSTASVVYSDDFQTSVFLPKGTNYLYIDIGGLYQNHLSYTKSINYDQLKGETLGLNLSDTKPFDYNGDLPYYPAGAIASTFFQDRISLEGLEIETDDISWRSEADLIGFTSYIPGEISIPEYWTSATNENTTPLNTTSGSGLPILNERFVNWISLAFFPDFKKLWGRVEVPKSGNYKLMVESSYDLSKSKGVLFSQKSTMGIPNYLGSACMIAMGVLSMLGAYYLRVYGY